MYFLPQAQNKKIKKEIETFRHLLAKRKQEKEKLNIRETILKILKKANRTVLQ